MSDPCHGIQSPCPPAGCQPARKANARALPISLTPSYRFDSRERAGERFDAPRAIGRRVNGRRVNGRSARPLVIQPASMTFRSLSEDEPRAGAASRNGGRLRRRTEMLDHRVRDLDRAPTKTMG